MSDRPVTPVLLPMDPPADEVVETRRDVWVWIEQVHDWRRMDVTGRWRSPEGRWAARCCNDYLGAPQWPGRWFWWDTLLTR